MFTERLTTWYTKHGRLPSKVIYYRDGVGDLQYASVLGNEVSKIEAAYTAVLTSIAKELAKNNIISIPKPSITAVLVTKRHHTCFYPNSDIRDKNCNSVTHQAYFDFYLQSHLPVKGTARPTYYFVIRNDIAFSADQLQALTNNLCYTYVHCTSPVGYAPPAYYAGKLSFHNPSLSPILSSPSASPLPY
jgi:hypothetical protein